MTSHFSLNIKTLSAQTNAMVLSIGIIKFNEEQIIEGEQWFLDTSAQTGRHVETDRLHWWFREHESNSNISAFLIANEFHTPRSALKLLNAFIHKHGSIPDTPDTPVNFMWMRGIQFDWAILEDMSHEYQTGLIFQHNALRDQRTFCDEVVKHEPKKNREAICDASYHAQQIQKALKLKGKHRLK